MLLGGVFWTQIAKTRTTALCVRPAGYQHKHPRDMYILLEAYFVSFFHSFEAPRPVSSPRCYCLLAIPLAPAPTLDVAGSMKEYERGCMTFIIYHTILTLMAVLGVFLGFLLGRFLQKLLYLCAVGICFTARV